MDHPKSYHARLKVIVFSKPPQRMRQKCFDIMYTTSYLRRLYILELGRLFVSDQRLYQEDPHTRVSKPDQNINYYRPRGDLDGVNALAV